MVPLFEAERARLLALLGSLDGGDWQRATPRPGWSVLGLTCHLLGDDLDFLARHRDRYDGTEAPPDQTEPEFIAWLDDLQME